MCCRKGFVKEGSGTNALNLSMGLKNYDTVGVFVNEDSGAGVSVALVPIFSWSQTTIFWSCFQIEAAKFCKPRWIPCGSETSLDSGDPKWSATVEM
jgi:hypothetical protein